jgi:hypothetical protein
MKRWQITLKKIMFLKSYRGDANMNSLTVDTPSRRKVFTNKSLIIGEALSFIGQVRDRLLFRFFCFCFFIFLSFWRWAERIPEGWRWAWEVWHQKKYQATLLFLYFFRQHYFHLFLGNIIFIFLKLAWQPCPVKLRICVESWLNMFTMHWSILKTSFNVKKII